MIVPRRRFWRVSAGKFIIQESHMPEKIRLIESLSNNPYFNLAAESDMVDSPDGTFFFLWSNAPTVVIGYNQNPFSECDLKKMQEKSVFLARRRTGGGAVFHDKGNLNFSFVMPYDKYDVQRQSEVICNALLSLGIKAEISGRNDLLADGRKFSGNAYYKGKTHRLHHGTIMFDVDFKALSGFLTPAPSKYLKKGVSSVRSRVVNLCELKPDLTIAELKSALFFAFKKEYGVPDCIEPEKFDVDNASVSALAERISGDEYLFGKWRDFSSDISFDFAWGHVDASIKSTSGKIKSVVFSTDGLFPAAVEFAEKYISAGCVGKDDCVGEDKNAFSFPDLFTEEDKKVFHDLIKMVC